LVILLTQLPQAQGTPPATPLTLVTRDARRPIATTIVNNQELIALDDVVMLFQVAVREDTLAGGITLTYRGRTVVLSSDQAMASVGGRVMALPSPPVRAGRRWLVPVEVLPSALGQIYDSRIELRRPSRLLLVGDVRVPRVSVRIDAAGAPTHATVEIVPAAPTAAAVEQGRITLRIEADALDSPAVVAGGGLIDSVRVEQPGTIVLNLSPRAMTARAVPATADGATRVAIDVAAAPVLTETPPPVAPAPGPAPVEPPVLTAPRTGVQAIVIDPGHGGDDAGVRGPGGTLEKQITLDVARRLRTAIETRLGVRVIMTRDDDRAVSLDERAAMANNGKAGLFLSLHANGAPSPAVSGAEIFTMQLDREGEQVRRTVTAQEVMVPILGGGSRPIDVIRWDLAQARHVDASAMLAATIDEELRKHVPMSARPLRRAPMRVLAGVNMPAALVEMGYLSNAGQEKALKSGDLPAAVAQALFDAVLRFRDTLEERR
jgi:N-acetylmuramoyl-L-alanine amidase